MSLHARSSPDIPAPARRPLVSAASLVLVLAALVAGTSIVSASPGNPGTVDVQARAGCVFDVELRGFGVTQPPEIATLIFTTLSASRQERLLRADSVALSTTSERGVASAGAMKRYHVLSDFGRSLTGVEPGPHGFHVDLTVLTSSGVKQKTFWMEDCRAS